MKYRPSLPVSPVIIGWGLGKGDFIGYTYFVQYYSGIWNCPFCKNDKRPIVLWKWVISVRYYNVEMPVSIETEQELVVYALGMDLSQADLPSLP